MSKQLTPLQWATVDGNKDHNFKIFCTSFVLTGTGYWQQLACLSGVNSTNVLSIFVNIMMVGTGRRNMTMQMKNSLGSRQKFRTKQGQFSIKLPLLHTGGSNLNLRLIQDTSHQHRTCPRNITSLNYNIFNMTRGTNLMQQSYLLS